MTGEYLPQQYKLLSPWAYFGYNILFCLPIIGLIFMIVFALDNSNINRRNYARSFLLSMLISFIIALVFILILGVGVFAIAGSMA